LGKNKNSQPILGRHMTKDTEAGLCPYKRKETDLPEGLEHFVLAPLSQKT